MKIAINPTHENKMPRLSGSAMKDWWRKFNGGFNNFDLPDADMLIAEVKNGHAYTTQHTQYRKADNFRCGQHVGLDFDTGDHRSSFAGILEDEFIKDNAYFLHTTASHTEHTPRARAIFILEREIYSVEKYSLLTEAFAETYKTNGAADPSCKDPVRLFFGSRDCTVLYLGNTLTFNKAAEIVNPYKGKMSEVRKVRAGHINPVAQYMDRGFLIDGLVGKILNAPNGNKWYILGKVSREAGGYVGAGYFDETYMFNQLYQAISSRPSTQDLDVAEETISWGLTIGQMEPLYLEEDKDPLIQKMFA